MATAHSTSTPENKVLSAKVSRVRDYFTLENFEGSLCFLQANNIVGIILNAAATQTLPELDKIFAHTFICLETKCFSICKLFNLVAFHVNNHSHSHYCALRYVYNKFATLHFDTCHGVVNGKPCEIPNCDEFRRRRRERRIMKRIRNYSLLNNTIPKWEDQFG